MSLLYDLPHQVLTAIYPAPTVAVSVTSIPPALAASAQDVMNPSSPLATGVQGSAVATSQASLTVEVRPKVEVKTEQDGQIEDGEQGTSGATWTSCTATGNTPVG